MTAHGTVICGRITIFCGHTTHRNSPGGVAELRARERSVLLSTTLFAEEVKRFKCVSVVGPPPPELWIGDVAVI